MTTPIRAGILGYGNLGRGVRAALDRSPDFRLEAVFSRRDPASLTSEPGVRFVHVDELPAWTERLDVLLLCGGSANDLPEQGPEWARHFVTIDSFDTHARIPDYHAAVDAAARAGDRLAVISSGWDPGLFSMARVLAEAMLPGGETYTFWGKGLSQGHSDAIRRVPGVRLGVQYTLPSEEGIRRVRAGERPQLSTRERHERECFIVLEEGADEAAVREAIVTMPNYFADYDTRVHVIDEATFRAEHNTMPHGGVVLRSGETGNQGHQHTIEFGLKLDSNPEFTGSVLVATARAAVRMYREGQRGARTVLDIPLGYFSPRSDEELRRSEL